MNIGATNPSQKEFCHITLVSPETIQKRSSIVTIPLIPYFSLYSSKLIAKILKKMNFSKLK